MVQDDEATLTLMLIGGPLDGRMVEVDPKDAALRIEAAPVGDGAVALGRLTLPSSVEAVREWELYERDPEDELRYRHVPDDLDDLLPKKPGDEWTWRGWGDWSDGAQASIR